MNPKDYVKGVLVTESRDFSPLKERMSLERNIRLLHGSLGLCTETAELFEFLEKEELDLVNLKEELGDALWYQGVIVDELGFDPEMLIQESKLSEKVAKAGKREQLNYHIDVLIKHVGLLQDLMKKSIFYGKPLAIEKVQAEMVSISRELSTLCLIGDIAIADCMDANIKKLRARYGEKFTEKAAVERDLAKERKILEKK